LNCTYNLHRNEFAGPAVKGFDHFAEGALAEEVCDTIWKIGQYPTLRNGAKGLTLACQFGVRDDNIVTIVVVNLYFLVLMRVLKEILSVIK